MEPAIVFWRRGSRRLSWELFQFRVILRRRALDLAWPPKRQRAITRPIAPVLSTDTTAHLVPPPSAIEPRNGYVVHELVGVIEASLPHSERARHRSQRQYFNGVPHLGELLHRRHTETLLDGVPISIRHPFDSNYFHATVDCMGAIAAAEERGLLRGNPLVIGPGLEGTSVWRGFLGVGGLSDVTYVVQEADSWLRGRNGIMFAWPGLSRYALHRTASYLQGQLPASNFEAQDLRIYVSRGRGAGRNARNADELEDMLIGRGFAVVDPGRLTWAEQVRVFRRASCVIGIHGAALTNIIYRYPEPMQILEIHPPGGSETMYHQMASMLGYEYLSLEGSNASGGGNRPYFDVDISLISSTIDTMVR